MMHLQVGGSMTDTEARALLQQADKVDSQDIVIAVKYFLSFFLHFLCVSIKHTLYFYTMIIRKVELTFTGSGIIDSVNLSVIE